MKIIYWLIKLIKFFTDKNVGIGKKLLFIFPIIYFFSPITIIPYYFFPLAGWVDNVLVLLGMSIYLKKILADYDPVKARNQNKKKKKEDQEDVFDINDDDYEVK